jgi:hypothetical protein
VLGVNLDYRYEGGFPSIDDVRRHGIGIVRCISLPTMEYWAERYLLEGCRVLAVYTGESDNAGRYVMQNCSAVQIGNEPFMNGDATWPSGGPLDVIDVWLRVRDLVWRKHGAWWPLMGPALWSQDYARWAMIAHKLDGVTCAAVHVYPDPSGHSLEQVKNHLQRYRSVRNDLPLVCTEWMTRWPGTLSLARAIDTYCDSRCWYTWNDPGQPHHTLAGTPELGILAMAK